jgi:hypothetical protein
VASAWVYHPITQNFFHADDFVDLYRLADGRTFEFLVRPHAGHLMLVQNGVVWLCHRLVGMDPRGYFWVALLTHLVNVWLLFEVVRLLTGSARVACACALLWGTSPLEREVLGWFSIYKQVILTTFALAVLRGILRVARGEIVLTRATACAWYACLLLGAASFAIGIGIAFLTVPVIWLLLGRPEDRFARWLFLSLPVVVLVLYVTVTWKFAQSTVSHEDVIPPGAYASITGGLRVPAMAFGLFVAGVSETLAGWLVGAGPLPTAVACAIAALWTIGAGVVAWRAPTLERRTVLTCLAFALAAYVAVALGRAWVFPMFMPLAYAATRLRFQYVAPAYLVIVTGAMVAYVAAYVPASRRAADATLALWVAVVSVRALVLPVPIDHYDDERRTVDKVRAAVRASAAQSPVGRPAFVQNAGMLPVAYYAPPAEFPGWAGLFVIFEPENQIDGRTIYFVEPAATTVMAVRARQGSRTAGLLLMPDEARRLGGAPSR